MRIVYIGTGAIGLPALRFLLDDPRYEVCAVVCQPDKPAGRRMALTPPPTKVLALERHIPVFQPPRIREAAEAMAGLGPDVFIVMAYGQLLPQAVLDMPRLACLNLHASLLPRHRGASPVQAAILANDPESGLTVMYMNAGLDTGDILLALRVPIHPDETGGSLHDRLAELAPAALNEALPLIAGGCAPRTPQNQAEASHSGKLTRTDGVIDWSHPADGVARLIRAFHPWPGTTTALPAQGMIKVFPPVQVSDEGTGCPLPGTILHAGRDGLLVACARGAVRLHELQAAGRKRLGVSAFLAGTLLKAGDRFVSDSVGHELV